MSRPTDPVAPRPLATKTGSRRPEAVEVPAKEADKARGLERVAPAEASSEGRGASPASLRHQDGLSAMGGSDGPRCIAAMRIDGGTEFVLRADRDAAVPDLRRLIDYVLGFRASGDPRDVVVSIPIPSGVDPDLWGPTESISAIARICDARGRTIRVTFADQAVVHLRVDGWIKIRAKALALWADGLRPWLDRWLSLFAVLAGVGHCTAASAYAAGWRTHQLELCSDFQGVTFAVRDGENFVGAGRTKGYERLAVGEVLSSTQRPGGGFESLNFGSREANTSLSIYNKSHQIRVDKRIDPDVSMYRPVWAASGGYVVGEPVTRVEIRLRRSGLVRRIHDTAGRDTGERIDLRDPALLLDVDAKGQIWANETQRRRLVVPEKSRMRRDEVDPRWAFVRSVAGIREPLRLTQDRSVRFLTWHQRLRRVEDRITRDTVRYSDLRGRPTTETTQLAQLAAEAIARSPVDRGQHLERAHAEHEFIREECNASRVDEAAEDPDPKEETER